MKNLNRRTFGKAGLVSAMMAATGSLSPQALATGVPSDVKFPQDPKNLQAGLEAAHVPLIAIEKADAADIVYGKTPVGDFYRVTVQARHEATKEHHILSIFLYLNGAPIAEYMMNQAQAETSLPLIVCVQRLKAGDQLVVVTNCNKHGQWGNKVQV
jgi:desulfoferrodoxin (superoxide reductase-like protein)